MTARLETLAHRAVQGDERALDALVRGIQDDVYNLALRMLWHPQDAEDATQEILLKVVTRLATFRGESAFRTWVFRVATNHVLNARRSCAEDRAVGFAEFGEQLATGLGDPPAADAADAEQGLLVEEVKVGCTLGMLLCLDRDHRVAYILGEIFEMRSEEAADVLDIAPAAFRKRLSRARDRVRTFMRGHCGLVNPENPCRCTRQVRHAGATGRLDRQRLLFARHSSRAASRSLVFERIRELEELERAAAVFRSHPDYAAPERVVAEVRRVVRSSRYKVLE